MKNIIRLAEITSQYKRSNGVGGLRVNEQIDYKGSRENNSYEDPCLTCEHYEKIEDCCCKTWTEWEDKRINALFENDYS